MILIGGVPGSGKSYIGKELAALMKCPFIDKDTVSRFFSEKMLEILGTNQHDRESEIYLNNVRNLEYQTMMKVAFENIHIVENVICSAPFIKEFGSQDWVQNIEFDLEIEEAELVLVWIHADTLTAKHRIISRGAERDNWKLSNWEQYTTDVSHDIPQNKNFHVIDNNEVPNVPLNDQIDQLILKLS